MTFFFDLADDGGFAWSLGATTGKPPSDKIMLPAGWEVPALHGAFTGVCHTSAIASFNFVRTGNNTYLIERYGVSVFSSS